MESKEFRIGLFMLPLLTQGGGAEKYFIEIAENLNEKGIQADIITMDKNFFQKFARLIHIFTHGNFFGKINISGRESEEGISHQLGKARWIKASYKNLGKILRDYDIIYSKNELVELILLKRIGYKKLPPVIVGVHTPIIYPKTNSFISKLHNFLYLSFFYKWLLRGARCVHVSNEFTKKIIEDKFRIKSRLVYYPFSTRKVADSTQKNKCNIEFNTDKKNIIFVGRFGEQKGIDALISIIQKISGDENLKSKVNFNIFGSGDKEYENEIKDLAEKYPFIRYFGHIENKYMPHILSQQDLMIAPSKWETLPYSILEAQGTGLPVIAFDIPGPSDVIGDSKTGFLVNSKEDFFEKIKDIIEGKISFDRNVIVQNIEKKFSPEKIYSELINMFQKNL